MATHDFLIGLAMLSNEQNAADNSVVFIFTTLLGRMPSAIEIRQWSGRTWQEMLEGVLSLEEYRWRNLNLSLAELAIDKVVTIPTRYGFKMPVSLKDPILLLIFARDYEPEESDFVYANVRQGMCCVDLGARHGWFTGLMAEKTGPSGHVYSFEPAPQRTTINDLAELNRYTNISYIEEGVSDKISEREFDGATMSIMEGGQFRIKTTTLDTALAQRNKPIDFIKIDIEGAEYLALQGATEILKRDKPLIIMELNESYQKRVSGASCKELIGFMEGLKYQMEDVAGSTLLYSSIESDLNEGKILNVVLRPALPPAPNSGQIVGVRSA